MATDVDFIKMVTRMIELTQEGKLYWEKMNPTSDMNSSFTHVKTVYVTRHKSSRFRLYETKSKVFEEDMDSRFYWDSDIVLEVVDENGYVLHKIPTTIAKDGLLAAVKNQDTSIDDVLADLLGE